MAIKINYVEIDVTDACNMNCKHCYKNRNRKNLYLSVEDIDRFLGILAEQQDITNIVISGGEPLMYPRLYDLLDILNSRYNIRLNSNGILLDKNIDFLSRMNKFKLQISMDGYDKESYIKFRQCDAFDLILRNAVICKEKGINVEFRTTIGKNNIDSYECFVELSRKTGIPVKFKPIVGLDNVESECLTISELREWYKELVEKKLDPYAEGNLFNAQYSCPIIKPNPVISALYIEETGDIHPCLGLIGDVFCVGNIRNINYHILEDNIYRKRDLIKKLLDNANCRKCEIRKTIGNGTCIAACYYGKRECVNKMIGDTI